LKLGKFIDLGNNPAETAADVIISTVSGFAEAIALLGPIIFVTALSPARHEPPRFWLWAWRGLRRVGRDTLAIDATPAPGVAAVGNAGLARTGATPAKRKKPSRIKAAVVRELGDVREWKESRAVPGSGSKVKPGDAYAAYEAWCAEMRKEPVSLTAFGTIMKGELGVLKEEKNKRGFYLGIALVGTPKLVAAGVR
jgi:hypothetical protein